MLTLANPATVVSFLALAAAFVGARSIGASEAAVFAIGVTAGSAAWWLILAASVNAARRVASDAFRRALDALAGAALAAIGLVAIHSVL